MKGLHTYPVDFPAFLPDNSTWLAPALSAARLSFAGNPSWYKWLKNCAKTMIPCFGIAPATAQRATEPMDVISVVYSRGSALPSPKRPRQTWDLLKLKLIFGWSGPLLYAPCIALIHSVRWFSTKQASKIYSQPIPIVHHFRRFPVETAPSPTILIAQKWNSRSKCINWNSMYSHIAHHECTRFGSKWEKNGISPSRRWSEYFRIQLTNRRKQLIFDLNEKFDADIFAYRFQRLSMTSFSIRLR